MRALVIALVLLGISATAYAEKRNTRAIIIVPASQQAAANLAAEVVGGGKGTFSVPIIRSTDPDATAPTHYLCNWQMTPSQRTTLKRLFDNGQRARKADPSRGIAELIAVPKVTGYIFSDYANPDTARPENRTKLEDTLDSSNLRTKPEPTR